MVIAVATWVQIIGWTALALVGFGLMALVVMIRNAGDDEWEDEPEPKPVGPPSIPRKTKYTYHGRSESQQQRLRGRR